MKKIAVILDELFEDSEYKRPVQAFKDEDMETTVIGLEKGKKLKGKNGSSVVVDKDIAEVSVDDFDGLLIPGGYSPDKLRAHEKAVNFVKDFMKTNKPVFVICHGGQLLVSADVLKNRTVTGYQSIKQDLINAGAEFKDQEVVIDGNLVSSRNPGDLPYFIKAGLEKLLEK